MKVKINCPKCKSTSVTIIAEEGNFSPMYKCNECGHKDNLFPQLEKKEDKTEN